MKDVLTIFCAVSAALLALSGCGGRNDEAGGQAGSAPEAATECAAEDVSALPPGFSPDSLMAVDGKVGRGEFFSTLLMRLGMSASEAYALSAACDTVFDVRISVRDAGAVQQNRIFFEGNRVVLNEPARLEVYNAEGLLINAAHTDRMDLSGMPKGIYIVKAGDATRKLVVQ